MADDTWRLRGSEGNGVLTGATGPQGPQGAPGPQGAQGAKGDTGPIGLTGATGLTGAIGAQGPQGVQGPVGPQGAGVAIKGSVASPSALPATGNTLGDTYIVTGSGSGYAAGDGYAYTGGGFVNVGQIRGPAGVAGAQGPQGPAGANGVAGATGAKGDKGDTGLQGPAGAQGAAGMTGAQGIQGSQGPAGANGTNGSDATAPAGAMFDFAGQTPPNGYLKCNGASLSRGAYPSLFAAIGTLYGAADANSFNLPDARGMFSRTLDDGRGIDTNRAIGTTQTDAFRDHTHSFSAVAAGGSGNAVYVPNGGSNIIFGTTGASLGAGTETRPINIAFLKIIKAF